MFIQVRPIWGAEPLMCIHNVEKRINALGGSKAFGWRIDRDTWVIRKQSHCVWQDEDGTLFDVTPVYGKVEGPFVEFVWEDETEFERDDEAVFTDKALPGKYVPRSGDKHLSAACSFMERADVFLHEGNLEKCRYWTERANREVAKAGLPFGWAIPGSMEMSEVLACR